MTIEHESTARRYAPWLGLLLGSTAATAWAQQTAEAAVADSVPVAEVAADTTEGEAPAEAPRSGNRFIEEIVVTAQKREENLMEVPISIAAFSGETLEARGAGNPEDLKFVTPGLVYDNLVGYSLIYMRGVGTEIFTPHGEPSVATYIDGIYFPFSHGLAQDFTKLERVEVLKGPQGTLFGRNATGGAINIISKSPGDQWETSLDVGIRNYDGRQYKAYFTGPLTDGLSFSISALYDYEEPYYKLTSQSVTKTLNPNVSKGFNPRLQWKISDSLTAMVSAYTAEFDGTGTVVNTNTDPKPAGIAVGVIDAGDRKAAVSEPEIIVTDTKVIYGNLVWETALADVKLLGGTQRAKTDTRWDYDGGPWNAVYFWPTNQFFDSDTAELQFVSNTDTPGSEFLEWTAGLYHFKSRAGFDPLFVGAFRFNAPGPAATVIDSLFNGIESLDLDIPLPYSAATLILRGVVKTESTAAYGQAKWFVNDWMGVTLGARFQQERREMVKSNTGVALDGIADEQGVQVFDFMALRDYVEKNDDFSPKVGFDFKLPDETLLYASWSQAYKSGTYNIVAVYTPPQYVKPEKITSWELGAKGYFFDRSLRYSAALFHNQIDDVQTQVVSLLSGGLLSLANGASATIYGAEFDLTWQVLPDLLPGLVINAQAGYLEGEYDSFPEGPGFDETTGLFFGPGGLQQAQDFSGKETVRTPKYSGSFGLSYTFDVPGGPVEIASDVYYNDGYFFDTQNVVEQPSYYTLNARASYLYEPWHLRVSVIGKNLTDQFYYYNIFATDFGESATGGPPPSYGVALSWTF